MQSFEVVEMMKKAKSSKKFTMNEIAEKSSIGIRTVNRIFARQDERFSSIVAVLKVLDIDLTLHMKAVA